MGDLLSCSAGTGWSVISAVAVLSAFANMSIFMTAAIGVQLRDDLDIGATTFGVVVASGHGMFAVGSLFMGRIVTLLGSQRSLRVGAVVSSSILAAIGGVAGSAPALGVLVGAAGLTNSLVQTAATVMLASVVPNRRLGLAFGLKQSAAPLATFVSGLSVPVLAVTLGWRWAFLGAALFAAPLALIVPRRQMSRPVARADRRVTAWRDIRPLAVVAVSMCGAFAAANGGITFLVSAAVEAGISESFAGLLFALGSCAGIVARVGFGHLLDRREGHSVGVIAVLLLAGAGSYLALSAGHRGVLLVATPLVFVTAWAFPGLLLVTMVRLSTATPAVTACVIGVGAGTGSVVGPIVFGAIAEDSYARAFVAAAAGCTVAVPGLVVGARRMRAVVSSATAAAITSLPTTVID